MNENNNEFAKQFLASDRKHILMITNHGIHEWQVIPGLKDTGGQNVFVNHFTDALAKIGYKITITNRGGFQHPRREEIQEGVHYKNEHERILYLEDGTEEFVRKEDMGEQIPKLVDFLWDFLEKEQSDVDLIVSHYWDGAMVGKVYNDRREKKLKHVWVPHSLGALKKKNVDPSKWEGLRIDERIEYEQELVKVLDGIASTSSSIRSTLRNDYGYESNLFLPPCVDADRFKPREIPPEHEIWGFLAEKSGLSVEEIQQTKIVTEISRTDTTKRKNVVIQAFAKSLKEEPNAFLVVAIDRAQEKLADELLAMIEELGIKDRVAPVGSVWDILPYIYAATDVYLTPSVMEGFGMSPQEAAAAKSPTVASNLVPFVVEYLLGKEVKELDYGDDGKTYKLGEGAAVVMADDVDGFAAALSNLLTNDQLREQMAQKAYEITIPYFTWRPMTNRFLETIGFK